MQKHQVLAAAVMTFFLLSIGPAFAGPPAAKGRGQSESAEPGAMPKERARIMGYGPDDPRAAADARRNLSGTNDADNEAAKVRKDERRKAKKAKGR